jgi:glycosyltransferase involved in cell wall biosynthesis
MKRLVIIDEYFVNKSGHYYEYNKSVKEIFEAHHVPTVIYANQKLDQAIRAELGAVACLEGLQKNALNKIPVLGALANRARFWRSQYKKLKQLYRTEQADDTVFFYSSVFWLNVLPIALTASKAKQKSALLFRQSISDHGNIPLIHRWLASKLYHFSFRKLTKKDNILFFTDSDVIADECNARYACNMKVLPIPHIKDDPFSGSDTPVAARLRVYAPGAIREEKGIEFITRSFEHLSRLKHPVLSKIILVTQYNEAGDTQLNEQVRQRLQQLSVDNEFLGTLSSEEYNRQLHEADIILIPYSIAHGYKARTSGIMSETIAACKPFITTKDSWMSIQSEKYNTGLSVAYNSVTEFADALAELVDRYDYYTEKAEKAKVGWLNFHSKDNFYRIINNVLPEGSFSAKK